MVININNKNSPKISIIINVLENKNMLKKCLKSISKQTLIETEIFCINNEKEDMTEIINDFKEKNSIPITVHTALNLKDINGEYIFPIDSNSWFLISGLETIFKIAKKNNSDIVLCSYYNYLSPEKIYEPKAISNLFIDNTNEFNKISTEIFSMNKYLNNLYKKTFLNTLSVNIPLNNSFDYISFQFKSIFSAKNIYIYKQPIFYKLKSIKQENKINVNNLFENIDDLILFFKENNLYSIYKYGLLNYIINLLRNIYNSNLENKEEYYNKLYYKLNKYDSEYHIDFILNLNTDNLLFYKFVLQSNTCEKYELLYSKEKLKITKEKVQILLSENDEYQNQITKLQNEKNKIVQNNKVIQNKLNEIFSSKSWKITRIFRKIGWKKSIIILIVLICIDITIIILK